MKISQKYGDSFRFTENIRLFLRLPEENPARLERVNKLLAGSYSFKSASRILPYLKTNLNAEEIAKEQGLSRQRVHQLFDKLDRVLGKAFKYEL